MIYNRQHPENGFVVLLLVISSIILPSAFMYALPVSQRVVGFGIVLLTGVVFLVCNRRISIVWLATLMFGLLLSVITAAYWNYIGVIFFLGYIVLSVSLVGISSIQEIRYSVEIVSTVLLVLILLSWIAVAYTFQGGRPLFELGNPGQPLSLYLASLSLSVYGEGAGTLIRPAGIFDEPGAFAFFISLCAACRILLDLPKRGTLVLLLGGLVTMSLALMAFILVVGVGVFISFLRKLNVRYSLRSGNNKWWVIVSLMFMVVAVIYHDTIVSVGDFIVRRLQFAPDSERIVAGDSRTEEFLVALKYVNLKTFLFGADITCFTDLKDCYNQGVGGGNPLLPMLMRGVLSQFLYYYLLLMLIVMGLMRPKKAVYIAVVLMFLQRPYILSFGYSTWAVLVLMIDEKMRKHQMTMEEQLHSFSTENSASARVEIIRTLN